MKPCSKCQKVKPLVEFYRHSTDCKVCNKQSVKDHFDANREVYSERKRVRSRHYRLKNLEAERERSREYQRRHPEVGRAWRERNTEKVKAQWREYSKQYYDTNKDAVKVSHHGYYLKTKDQARKRTAQWLKAHPEITRANCQKRRARERAQLGWLPPKYEWLLYQFQEGKCLYCNSSLGEFNAKPVGYHLDHQTPLVKGGLHDWENVCLACPSCNLTKHDKTREEFERIRLN